MISYQCLILLVLYFSGASSYEMPYSMMRGIHPAVGGPPIRSMVQDSHVSFPYSPSNAMRRSPIMPYHASPPPLYLLPGPYPPLNVRGKPMTTNYRRKKRPVGNSAHPMNILNTSPTTTGITAGYKKYPPKPYNLNKPPYNTPMDYLSTNYNNKKTKKSTYPSPIYSSSPPSAAVLSNPYLSSSPYTEATFKKPSPFHGISGDYQLISPFRLDQQNHQYFSKPSMSYHQQAGYDSPLPHKHPTLASGVGHHYQQHQMKPGKSSVSFGPPYPPKPFKSYGIIPEASQKDTTKIKFPGRIKSHYQTYENIPVSSEDDSPSHPSVRYPSSDVITGTKDAGIGKYPTGPLYAQSSIDVTGDIRFNPKKNRPNRQETGVISPGLSYSSSSASNSYKYHSKQQKPVHFPASSNSEELEDVDAKPREVVQNFDHFLQETFAPDLSQSRTEDSNWQKKKSASAANHRVITPSSTSSSDRTNKFEAKHRYTSPTISSHQYQVEEYTPEIQHGQNDWKPTE